MEKAVKFSFIEKVSEQELYPFRISKGIVDRDGDLLIPEGFDYSNFKKNPVILFAHNYHSFPVGKAEKIDTEQAIVHIRFADTEEGRKVKELVDGGYLNAVSIGFIPKEIITDVDEFKKRYPELYEKYSKEAKKATRWIIPKAELLEISVVPVPANPEALIVMRSKGMEYYCAFLPDNEKCVKLVTLPLEVKNAVSYSAHPDNMAVDSESSWDKRKAEESLRKWASSDGSGDKDKIDWTKYRAGFGWYDANVPDNFGSYKLPHHWVKDGKFYVVWRGVVSAMATLLGARGGVDIPAKDKKSVYNHLARHYKENFDREPPEYKEAGYSLKEALSAFDEDLLKEFIKYVEPTEVVDLFKEYQNEIKELSDKVTELEKQLADKANNTAGDKDSGEDRKEGSPPVKGEDNEPSEGVEISEEDIKEAFKEVIKEIIKNQ